jgi:predicted MPP superfamily phosphohydrolase
MGFETLVFASCLRSQGLYTVTEENDRILSVQCCQSLLQNIIFVLSSNLFFSGNTCTILNSKIYLELPKHKLFFISKRHFFENDVLKLKIVHKVKKSASSTVKS